MQSNQKSRRSNFIDLIGMMFGRLSVTEMAPSVDSRGNQNWICVCECGKSFTASGSSLRRGKTKSCGCLMIEMTKLANTTHGMRNTKLYRIWSGMLTRCRNRNSKDFPDYGGRGIKVCVRWQVFQNFFDDMGRPPEGNYTIERRENDGDYCIDNCKWVTRQDQAKNRRSSVFVEHGGRRLVASDWDRELGFYPGTVAKRVRKGLSEEGVFAPIRKELSRPQRAIQKKG